MRTPHDLAQGSVFEVRETGAVLGLRQEQVPQILRACLILQLLHHSNDLPGIPAATILLQLVVETRLRWVNEFIHERAHALLQVADLVTVGEIHTYPSADCCTNRHASSASGRALRPACNAVALEALP